MVSKYSKNKVLFIEFVGPPAAGKTTLANHITEELIKRKEFKIYQQSDLINKQFITRKLVKLFYFGYAFFCNPGNSIKIVIDVIDSRQNSYYDYYLVIFNSLYVQGYILNSMKKGGVHVLDQGFFQSIFSIAYNSKKGEEAIKKNIKKLPSYNCIIVFVKANSSIITDRLRNREQSISRINKDNANKETINKYIDLLELETNKLHDNNIYSMTLFNHDRDQITKNTYEIINKVECMIDTNNS